MEHIKKYQIYKPRKDNNGAASQWSIQAEKNAVFLEISKQTGEKKFDWDKKLIMKLGINDIGSLMSVLEKREIETELFHQNPKGNSSLKLKKHLDQKNKDRGWVLTMGVKREDAEFVRISHGLTFAEGAILLVLLRQAVLLIYGW